MGLGQTISEWVRVIKDTFDFGPEFPAALASQRVKIAQRIAQMHYLLEETRKASGEKDELIAGLQAAGAVKGSMIVDGPAYYVKGGDNILEGPFCTCCFEQKHEMTRIELASEIQGDDEGTSGWVQCVKCQAPFQSDRISQYLSPAKAAAIQTPVPPEPSPPAEPLKARRKSPSRSRRPKN